MGRKKSYAEYTAGDWAKKRNLKPYRDMSEAEWQKTKADLIAGIVAEMEAPASRIIDLESTLDESLRPAYRKAVNNLAKVLKQKVNLQVVLPLIEESVYYSFVLRKQMVAVMEGNIQLNERGLSELITKRMGTFEKFALTPKEIRLSGDKTDDSLSAALKKSEERMQRQLQEATSTETEDVGLFEAVGGDG